MVADTSSATSNAPVIGSIKIEFTTDVARIAGMTGRSGMSIATSSPLVSEQAQARYSVQRLVVRRAQSLAR